MNAKYHWAAEIQVTIYYVQNNNISDKKKGSAFLD